MFIAFKDRVLIESRDLVKTTMRANYLTRPKNKNFSIILIDFDGYSFSIHW